MSRTLRIFSALITCVIVTAPVVADDVPSLALPPPSTIVTAPVAAGDESIPGSKLWLGLGR